MMSIEMGVWVWFCLTVVIWFWLSRLGTRRQRQWSRLRGRTDYGSVRLHREYFKSEEFTGER